MDDEDGLGELRRRKLGRAEDGAVFVGVGDILRDHEHDRVDRCRARCPDVGGDRGALRLEKRHAIGELRQRVLPVVLADRR